jgi:hypothetical protein
MTWAELEIAEKLGLFETLNTKIASGLQEILHGEFQRKVFNADDKMISETQDTLSGRQIAFMII